MPLRDSLIERSLRTLYYTQFWCRAKPILGGHNANKAAGLPTRSVSFHPTRLRTLGPFTGD